MMNNKFDTLILQFTKTNLNRNTFGLGYFSFLSAFLRCFSCKHFFYFCYRLLCRERRLTRVWGVVGYFHPIQTYYIDELLEKVQVPIENDYKFMWIEYEQLKGKMFTEMQNWAIEMAQNFLK